MRLLLIYKTDFNKCIKITALIILNKKFQKNQKLYTPNITIKQVKSLKPKNNAHFSNLKKMIINQNKKINQNKQISQF